MSNNFITNKNSILEYVNGFPVRTLSSCFDGKEKTQVSANELFCQVGQTYTHIHEPASDVRHSLTGLDGFSFEETYFENDSEEVYEYRVKITSPTNPNEWVLITCIDPEIKK